jgi:N-acetylglutamate synthase-like GNAT family acetyltransferase
MTDWPYTKEEELLEKIEHEAGFLLFRVADENGKKFVELRRVWLEEDQRMKGIGTKLVRRLYKEARKRRIKTIFVKSTCEEGEIFYSFLTANHFINIKKTNGWNWKKTIRL